MTRDAPWLNSSASWRPVSFTLRCADALAALLLLGCKLCCGLLRSSHFGGAQSLHLWHSIKLQWARPRWGIPRSQTTRDGPWLNLSAVWHLVGSMLAGDWCSCMMHRPLAAYLLPAASSRLLSMCYNINKVKPSSALYVCVIAFKPFQMQ
jgi:hypothetical protein